MYQKSDILAAGDSAARLFSDERMDILICGERSDGLQIKEFAISRPAEKRNVILGVREPYFIHLILSGECVFNGETLHAGDATFLTSGKPFSYSTGDDYSLVWFGITGAAAPKLLRQFGISSNDHVSYRVRHADYVKEILKHAHSYSMDHLNDCASVAEGALLLFLSELQTGNCLRREPSTMEQAAAFFRDNYFRDLHMEDVARQFFLSEKYFCRRFREQYGVPPQKYLLTIRMERAASLLLSSDMKIKEVAAAVGYDSPISFSSAFRKSRGVTPGEYRRNAQGTCSQE